MSIRISPDANRPSATIEIPLENPLPDYDLLQLEQPTPRDVDAVLVSQGFRDLVDDARGVLMDLLAHPPYQASSPEHANLDFTHSAPPPLELAQLTGAICPGGDESLPRRRNASRPSPRSSSNACNSHSVRDSVRFFLDGRESVGNCYANLAVRSGQFS